MDTPQTPTQTHEELARLTLLECAISQERQLLHQQIDRLYLSAPLADEQTVLLDRLEEREQEISGERRRVHRQIDELRATVGLPPWRETQAFETLAS